MMDYSFDRTNQHLACCVHCMLENALLNTKEPETAMLLQAAIGAFNRMGENVEEQRKALLQASVQYALRTAAIHAPASKYTYGRWRETILKVIWRTVHVFRAV